MVIGIKICYCYYYYNDLPARITDMEIPTWIFVYEKIRQLKVTFACTKVISPANVKFETKEKHHIDIFNDKLIKG